MTGDEMTQDRLRRGMTYAEFGEWLAERVNDAQPEGQKPVQPYSRQRVYDWEKGVVPIPAKVETVILRNEIRRLNRMLDHERSGMVGREPTPDQERLIDHADARKTRREQVREHDDDRDDW